MADHGSPRGRGVDTTPEDIQSRDSVADADSDTEPTAEAAAEESGDDCVEPEFKHEYSVEDERMEDPGPVAVAIPAPPGAATVMQVLAVDHKDAVLLGYFTALVKLFDGTSGNGDPTICSATEEVVLWVGFAVIATIYIIRHFYIYAPDPWLVRGVGRCVLFMLFSLCIHSQPISCLLPREAPPGNSTAPVASLHLPTLHYVQAAVVLTMAIIATELFSFEPAKVAAADLEQPEKVKTA